MVKLRSNVVLAGLALSAAALIACTAGTGGNGTGTGPGGSSPPEQTAEVNRSGLTVTATIASVTLGDECGSSSGLAAPSQDCAGDCRSSCESSNVQIAFTASAGGKAAPVEIVSVSLVDATMATVVDSLTASKPQVWNGSTYAPWDQNVTPGGDLKASYDLSSPGWSKIDGSGTAKTSSYSRSFKLHVTLRIDGVEVTLESVALNRQPQAVT